MNTGYFNDAKKEYVITDLLAPKRPWYNFIWNDKFISDFDQFGFGLSLVRDKNDKLREFTAKGDNRHVYIRDITETDRLPFFRFLVQVRLLRLKVLLFQYMDLHHNLRH